MKASDLFVRCLEEEGVEYVFGVPGEENLDLLESLRESRVQLVVTRHEQHAAFMAATYGRLTGRAGVCLSTLGPGATNLLTGVAYAQLGGMPLLAITGQKAIRDNRQGKFQLIDVVDTFQPVTKWAYSITDSGVIPRCVRHAFKLAESERPGAVHLELPEDIAGEDIAPSVPQRRITLRRPNADDQATQQAADMIRAARQPIIIYSAGANRKRITEQLEAFVEATGLKKPVEERPSGHAAVYGASHATYGDAMIRVLPVVASRLLAASLRDGRQLPLATSPHLHPIWQTIVSDTQPPTAYLVQPRFDTTLDLLLKREPLDEDKAHRIFCQLAHAVECLHDQQHQHGAVLVSNVLVRENDSEGNHDARGPFALDLVEALLGAGSGRRSAPSRCTRRRWPARRSCPHRTGCTGADRALLPWRTTREVRFPG